jgi:hypothetical protein
VLHKVLPCLGRRAECVEECWRRRRGHAHNSFLEMYLPPDFIDSTVVLSRGIITMITMKLMIRVTIFTLIVWHSVNWAQGLRCHGSLLPRASFARRSVSLGAAGNSKSLIREAVEDRVEVHSLRMFKKLGEFERSFEKLGEMHSDMVIFREQIRAFQALRSGFGLILGVVIVLSQFLGDACKNQLVRQMVLMGSAAAAGLLVYLVATRAVKNIFKELILTKDEKHHV